MPIKDSNFFRSVCLLLRLLPLLIVHLNIAGFQPLDTIPYPSIHVSGSNSIVASTDSTTTDTVHPPQ